MQLFCVWRGVQKDFIYQKTDKLIDIVCKKRWKPKVTLLFYITIDKQSTFAVQFSCVMFSNIYFLIYFLQLFISFILL